MIFLKFCSKGTPFIKILALPGNREKPSYRVSVSLPGVGKIPVARGYLSLACFLSFDVDQHAPQSQKTWRLKRKDNRAQPLVPWPRVPGAPYA